jgi:hypothetical protein
MLPIATNTSMLGTTRHTYLFFNYFKPQTQQTFYTTFIPSNVFTIGMSIFTPLDRWDENSWYHILWVYESGHSELLNGSSQNSIWIWLFLHKLIHVAINIHSWHIYGINYKQDILQRMCYVYFPSDSSVSIVVLYDLMAKLFIKLFCT